MSRVYVRQSAFTSYSAARLAGNTGVGAVSVTVNGVPNGAIANGIWVVIDAWTVQAEIRKVTSLSGNTIGFDALSFGHTANDPLLWVSEPVFNVMWFGAKGDAVTNDSPAIQAAITETEVNVYAGTVLFPQGQYKCVTALTETDNNITLLGQGLVQLVFTGTGNFLTVRGNYVTLENLYLTAGAGSAGHGIYLHDALRCRIRYCIVYGFQYNQLYTEDSYWLYSEHSEYSASSANTDAGYAGVWHEVNANNMVHFADRIVAGDHNKGCVLGGAAGLVGAGILFHGCDISGGYDDAGTAVGIEIGYALNVVIRDCYFEACNLYAINCGVGAYLPANVIITGNYFEGSYGTNQICINIQSAYAITIDGNYLSGGSKGTQTGIKIAWADQSVYRCMITNQNYIYNYITAINDTRGRANNFYGHAVRYGTTLTAPLDGGYSLLGDEIISNLAVIGHPEKLVCTATGADVKALWSTTTFVANDFVAATGNKIYRCVTAGGGAAANEPSHTSGDVTEADGYTWHYCAGSQTKSTWTHAGQIGYRQGAVSPNGVVTPYFIGEEYLDYTAEVWYKSTYAGDNTHWKALN